MWQHALILTNHFCHTWFLLWMSYLRISMMNMKIYHTLGFTSTIMKFVPFFIYYSGNQAFNCLLKDVSFYTSTRLDDADDPTKYLVSFDKAASRYVPLSTKLVSRKKRAKEGRSSDKVEHFPIPSRVTVR